MKTKELTVEISHFLSITTIFIDNDKLVISRNKFCRYKKSKPIAFHLCYLQIIYEGIPRR